MIERPCCIIHHAFGVQKENHQTIPKDQRFTQGVAHFVDSPTQALLTHRKNPDGSSGPRLDLQRSSGNGEFRLTEDPRPVDPAPHRLELAKMAASWPALATPQRPLLALPTAAHLRVKPCLPCCPWASCQQWFEELAYSVHTCAVRCRADSIAEVGPMYQTNKQI